MQFLKAEALENKVLLPVVSVSKSLTSAETGYSNTERETLGIHYDLEKFHHYCFSHDISMIPDHKMWVAIFKRMQQTYHTDYKE